MFEIFLYECLCMSKVAPAYTAGNATDLLQVVDFTGLLQVVKKFEQIAASLLTSSSCSKSVKIGLSIFTDSIFTSSLWIKSLDNQLAASLLTT